MTNTTADVTVYENEKWLYPIWKGDTVYAETAFILKNALGEIRPKRLAYPIQKIISVRSFDLKTVYEEGKDYEINEYGELSELERISFFRIRAGRRTYAVGGRARRAMRTRTLRR